MHLGYQMSGSAQARANAPVMVLLFWWHQQPASTRIAAVVAMMVKLLKSTPVSWSLLIAEPLLGADCHGVPDDDDRCDSAALPDGELAQGARYCKAAQLPASSTWKI